MGKYTRSRDIEIRGRYYQEAIFHGSMIVLASKELLLFSNIYLRQFVYRVALEEKSRAEQKLSILSAGG